MIWIIIGVLLGLIWGARDEFVGKAFGAVLGLIAGVLVTTLTTAAVAATVGLPPKKWVSRGEVKLVALNDTSETRGSFFLASGSFGGNLAYVYYAENADGNISLYQVDASRAAVSEEDREDATVEIIEDQTKELDWWIFRSIEEDFLVFHVPEGSVQREVTLDLES